MVFLNKDLFKQKITIEDLTYLSKIIGTNIPFNQALKLIENNHNSKLFTKITEKLNEGKLVEEILPDYLPKQIKDYFVPLQKSLSFSSALSLSLQFYERSRTSQDKILSVIAYPCILLFITITVLYLFDLYGMDTIFSLIGTFNSNLSIYQDIRLVFRIVINIAYYLLLIMSLLVIVLMQPSKITILYIFLAKVFPNSLITTYYSQEFVSLLLICTTRGYKTKESLHILKNMKTKPIINFLAFHMDKDLLEGETLKQATKKTYYDLSLSKFVKIANYTNDFENMLENFVSLAKEKIERKTKRYTLTIQLLTYSFIGIIIVFIYQILFMPMQALSMY